MQNEISLLKQASMEIKVLRRQNEFMRARLDMFDDVLRVLHTQPAQNNVGMSPDIAFEIDRVVEGSEKSVNVDAAGKIN